MCGTLLHLGMDFLNSYGVHPFWPIQNRWVYGDSVFIYVGICCCWKRKVTGTSSGAGWCRTPPA